MVTSPIPRLAVSSLMKGVPNRLDHSLIPFSVLFLLASYDGGIINKDFF